MIIKTNKIILLTVLSSCKKKNITVQSQPVNVYAVGKEKVSGIDMSCYWKNGELIKMNTDASTSSIYYDLLITNQKKMKNMKPKIIIILSLLCGISFNTFAQTKKKKTVAKKSTTKKVVTQQPVKIYSNTNNSTSVTTNSNSQNQTYQQMKNDLKIGKGSHINLGTFLDLGIGLNSYGVPIHAGLEKFIAQDITAGLFINYQKYNYNYIWAVDTWKLLYGGVKANYYFNHLLNLDSKKFNLYAGLSLGYWQYISSYTFTSGFKSGSFFLGSQVGGRYFFKKNIALFAEGGVNSYSSGAVGLSFKF